MDVNPRACASSDAAETGEPELMVLLPRLAGLGTAVNGGNLVERAMEQAGVGLDRPAVSVLVQLRMADETPPPVGEITHRTQVVGPHVTRQVNELERRLLVHRVVKALLGLFDRALAGWSSEDRRALASLLTRFTYDLTAHLAAA